MSLTRFEMNLASGPCKKLRYFVTGISTPEFNTVREVVVRTDLKHDPRPLLICRQLKVLEVRLHVF